MVFLKGILILYHPEVRALLDVKLFADLDSDRRLSSRSAFVGHCCVVSLSFLCFLLNIVASDSIVPLLLSFSSFFLCVVVLCVCAFVSRRPKYASLSLYLSLCLCISLAIKGCGEVRTRAGKSQAAGSIKGQICPPCLCQTRKNPPLAHRITGATLCVMNECWLRRRCASLCWIVIKGNGRLKQNVVRIDRASERELLHVGQDRGLVCFSRLC